MIAPQSLACPVRPACEACAQPGDVAVYEADTPVGVLCLTLCGSYAAAGRVPLLSCPGAVARVMAHDDHNPAASRGTGGGS